MNEQSPRKEGSAGSLGRDQSSVPDVHDERGLRWRIRGRLHACIAELEPFNGVEWDSVKVILEGAVEDIENAT